MNRSAAPLVVVTCLLVAGCGGAAVAEPGASGAPSPAGSVSASAPDAVLTPACADEPSGPDLVHASTGPDGAASRRQAGQDDELDLLERVEREFWSGDGLVGTWIDSSLQQVGVVWFGPVPEGLQVIEDSTADVDLVVHPSDFSRADLDAATDRLVAAFLEPRDDVASPEVDAVAVSVCNDGSGVLLTVAEDSVPGGAVPDTVVARVRAVGAPVPVLVVTGSRVMPVAAG